VQDLAIAYPPLLVLGLAAAGALIGLVGGLLGIGGGVIAVPLLLELWSALALPAAERTLLAVGTAQAVILLSALVAARAHARAGTIDAGVARAWAPAMLAGAALGLLAAPWIPPGPARLGFALIAALLGVQLLLGGRFRLAAAPPQGALGALPPGLIGAASAALGIGAGTLSGPVLSALGVPLGRAVGAGAVFNLVVAGPAVLAFAWQGLGRPGLPPDAVGYVALGATVLLAGPAMLVAPFAARLSARLPVGLLRRVFALCLFGIALRLVARGG